MGLFKPAWMSDNKEKALRAIARTNELSVLQEAARNAPLYAVRIKAVEKISSEIVLVGVMKNDKNAWVVGAAAKKLVGLTNDKSILEYISSNLSSFKNDGYGDVSNKASHRLHEMRIAEQGGCIHEWIEDDVNLLPLNVQEEIKKQMEGASSYGMFSKPYSEHCSKCGKTEWGIHTSQEHILE